MISAARCSPAMSVIGNSATPISGLPICACVDLLAQFREIHIGYADSYIHRQHQAHASNPTAVGTGGTPFMQYLQKHLDETKQALVQ